MDTGGPAGPAFHWAQAGLGRGASAGFALPLDEPDQLSQVITQEEGWSTFHLQAEGQNGSGEGGYGEETYHHELAYPPRNTPKEVVGLVIDRYPPRLLPIPPPPRPLVAQPHSVVSSSPFSFYNFGQ